MSKKSSRIELGDRVKDQVSGFSGIVTAEYNYLHGCRRLQVSPEKLYEGKPIDAYIFDEGALRLVAKSVVEPFARAITKTVGPGGDRPSPPSRTSPVAR